MPASQEELRERYDEWHRERFSSAAVVGDVKREEARFYTWLLELLEGRPGDTLLDVACGQGQFLVQARDRGFAISGVDVSPVAIEEARKHLPSAELRVADAHELPFEDSSFSRITCIGSLEHFPDPLAGAKEMARVLRKDGQAVIFVPNLYFLGHVYFGVRHGTQPSEAGQAFSELFLSSQGWTELLTSGGLEVRAFHPWNRIFATQKVGPVVTRAWNLVASLVPKNAAYAFAFSCGKGPAAT